MRATLYRYAIVWPGDPPDIEPMLFKSRRAAKEELAANWPNSEGKVKYVRITIFRS